MSGENRYPVEGGHAEWVDKDGKVVARHFTAKEINQGWWSPPTVIHEDEREREVPENQVGTGCLTYNPSPLVLSVDAVAQFEKFLEEAPKNAVEAAQKNELRRQLAKSTGDGKWYFKCFETKGLCENLTVKDGSLVKGHPDALPASTPELVAEAIKVGVERINERRALVLGEARAQISIRRTWPACPKDYLSMNIAEVTQLNDKRPIVILQCPKCTEGFTHELRLSPKALRALEAAGGAVRA